MYVWRQIQQYFTYAVDIGFIEERKPQIYSMSLWSIIT